MKSLFIYLTSVKFLSINYSSFFLFQAATLYCVCMEYAAGGELFSFIKIHPESRLPEDRARPFVRQILSAVHYLHERGVAHR